nr:MAG TPA: hypothetical protein [Bacteriophage sp.]
MMKIFMQNNIERFFFQKDKFEIYFRQTLSCLFIL